MPVDGAACQCRTSVGRSRLRCRQSRRYRRPRPRACGEPIELTKSEVFVLQDQALGGGLFNLAIDSKLRGCDVVAVKVENVAPNGYAMDRATVRQKKTGRPVKFELTDQARQAIDDYLKAAGKKPAEFLFSGRRAFGQCMTTRQYARLLSEWIRSIGLDPKLFGTHSLRRTKATLIYRRTGSTSRAVHQQRRKTIVPCREIFHLLGVGRKQDERPETTAAFPAVPNMTAAPIAPVLGPFGGDQLITALNAFHPEAGPTIGNARPHHSLRASAFA
jgi:hypothetical protein